MTRSRERKREVARKKEKTAEKKLNNYTNIQIRVEQEDGNNWNETSRWFSRVVQRQLRYRPRACPRIAPSKHRRVDSIASHRLLSKCAATLTLSRPLSNNSTIRAAFGISKITGTRNYSHASPWEDVRTVRAPARSRLHDVRLGCFSCFCMCCMGCKLSKNLGESSIAGCWPGSVQYMRTKLRTARRIQVRWRRREEICRRTRVSPLSRVLAAVIRARRPAVCHVPQRN